MPPSPLYKRGMSVRPINHLDFFFLESVQGGKAQGAQGISIKLLVPRAQIVPLNPIGLFEPREGVGAQRPKFGPFSEKKLELIILWGVE